MKSKVRILVVDDEKEILRAIRRMTFEIDLEMDYLASAFEAIKAFNDTPYDIILCDIKMPDMDGIKLLTYIKENFPTTSRIVLSGHVDGNFIFNIIKNSIAHSYMYKPWDNDKLISLLNKLKSARTIAINEDIMEVVGSIDILPIHPNTLKLIKSGYPFDEDDEKLYSILCNDPALALRFIHIANSLNAVLKPSTLSRAIKNLTKDQINKILEDYLNDKNLVLSMVEGSDLQIFWSYMMNNKEIIIRLYKYVFNKAISQEYKLIALLFDIGQLMHFEYSSLLKAKEISHEKLGAAILNLWGMPSDLIECALYHNDPYNKNVTNKDLVYLIALSNYINSIFHNREIQGFDWKVILEHFGKEESDFEKIIDTLKMKVMN